MEVRLDTTAMLSPNIYPYYTLKQTHSVYAQPLTKKYVGDNVEYTGFFSLQGSLFKVRCLKMFETKNTTDVQHFS